MTSALGDRLLVENYLPQHQTMRIAVVTETWPPEVNGVAVTLARLVQGLTRRGHSIQLIRPRQERGEVAVADQRLSEMLMRGLPIPRYPQLKLGLPGKKALIRAWTLQRPDLVHIATEGPLGWSALQAARKLRLQVTSDFRTNFHAYSQHYGVGWLRKPIVAYLRKFHNQTACTMVPTRQLRDELAAAGFQNLQVIARGVEGRLFSPQRRNAQLREAWGAEPDTLVLLSVGRLAAEKNLDVVIRTYHALIQEGRKVRLVFAGDGPFRTEITQRCPEAVLLGMCNHEQLADVYPSADLFLFPSMTETFGNVTLEALASGTPVLAFACAAALDLLQPQRNGWLIEAGDAAAFMAQARAVAQDVQALQAMRTATAASVADQGWDQIVAAVELVFRRSLGQAELL
jgi:glycosyltransferase involved in cell wall biosynthesis